MGDAQSAPGGATSGSLGLQAVCRSLAEVGQVEHLEEHVRRVVEAAPPLTAEQRDKLALLLGGSRV